MLTLKAADQGATKADIAELTGRLGQIEHLLGATKVSPVTRWRSG